MKKIICLLMAAVVSLFCGCTPKSHTSHFFAMDTVMTVTAYGDGAKDACQAAEKLIFHLASLADAYDEKSDIGKINSNSGKYVTVSNSTVEQIEKAKEICEKSLGDYDITVHSVYDAWGFTKENAKVPEDEIIHQLLEKVGGERVHIGENNTVMVDSGTQISLASIAKGYASQKAAQLLSEKGISSAVIDLGGNIYVLGKKADGEKWRIGVQDPFENGGVAVTLSVCDTAVVTSGSYQRNFTENGVMYHHIIDPKSGYPVDNELISVTVVCEDGAYADGLSTALFVMGLDCGTEFYKENGGFEAVFITKDEKMYVTKGIDASSAKYDLTYIE